MFSIFKKILLNELLRWPEFFILLQLCPLGFSSCPIAKWRLFSTSQSRICPCALLQPTEHSRSDVPVPIPGSKRHCILLLSLGTLRTPCDRLKASPLEDQDCIGKNHRTAPLPISQPTLVYTHPAEPQLMADT